jgi:hypothetical protein
MADNTSKRGFARANKKKSLAWAVKLPEAKTSLPRLEPRVAVIVMGPTETDRVRTTQERSDFELNSV